MLGLTLLAAAACGPSSRPAVGQATLTSAEGPSPGYEPGSIELYVARRAPDPYGAPELPSIGFDFDSAELAQAEDLKLRRLARSLLAEPFRETTIVLVGHTDALGPASYNLELGRDRAERVKERLVEHGLAPDRIVVTSAGESPVVPRGRPESRRVDVMLQGDR